MARVYAVPHYVNQVMHQFRTYINLDVREINEAYLCGMVGMRLPSMRDIYERLGENINDELREIEEAYSVGVHDNNKRQTWKRHADLIVAVAKYCQENEFNCYYDDHALFAILQEYLDGTMPAIGVKEDLLNDACGLARKIAMQGMIASFGTVAACATKAKNIPLYDTMRKEFPFLANMR